MKNKTGWRNRIIGLGLAAAALSLGSAATLHAEDSAYMAPPKGFQVTWKRVIREGGRSSSGTLVHAVTSSKGDEVVYKVVEPGGDEVRLLRGIFSYAFWRPNQGWAEYKFDKEAIRGLWPLKVGKEAVVKMQFGFGLAKTEDAARKKWTHTETGTIHYRVLRRENVTTLAGTFDAFVIQRDRTFTKHEDQTTDSHSRVAWFVPSLGYVVKQIVIYKPGNPKSRRTTIEALRIVKPGIINRDKPRLWRLSWPGIRPEQSTTSDPTP